MKAARCTNAAVVLVIVFAGCQRQQEAAPTSTPATSPAAAPQASGPILAPQAALPVPTEEARRFGARLAAEGAANVGACASCHGPMGEGNAATGFPRLAGQSYVYLLHELDSYFDESRSHPVMTAIGKAMSPAQREAGAAYYASLGEAQTTSSSGTAAAAATGPPQGPAGAHDRAQQLSLVGDESLAVQACVNCHGPGGIGLGVTFPYLAGQHAAYLSTTLHAWRDGMRRNDPSGQMPLIAKSLLDEDVQALANYYARLPPPPRRDADFVAGAAPAAAPAASAVVSGPRSDAGQAAGAR